MIFVFGVRGVGMFLELGVSGVRLPLLFEVKLTLPFPPVVDAFVLPLKLVGKVAGRTFVPGVEFDGLAAFVGVAARFVSRLVEPDAEAMLRPPEPAWGLFTEAIDLMFAGLLTAFVVGFDAELVAFPLMMGLATEFTLREFLEVCRGPALTGAGAMLRETNCELAVRVVRGLRGLDRVGCDEVRDGVGCRKSERVFFDEGEVRWGSLGWDLRTLRGRVLVRFGRLC